MWIEGYLSISLGMICKAPIITNNKCHKICAHIDRFLKDILHQIIVTIGEGVSERHIKQCDGILVSNHCQLECSFKVRFVKTWECCSCICWLKMSCCYMPAEKLYMSFVREK